MSWQGVPGSDNAVREKVFGYFTSGFSCPEFVVMASGPSVS